MKTATILISRANSLTHRAILNAYTVISSYTTSPLRISTVLGLLCSLFAFLYMVYILFCTLFFGEPVRGYPTMMVVILFLGGAQLLSLGIIGEYLGRIFHESKHRPVYFVAEHEAPQGS